MMTAASGEAAPTTAITNTANPPRDAAADWASARPFLWRFIKILAMASSLAYVLRCFIPHSIPDYDPRFILDNSWIQTLHVAFEHHWQFGRDIIFTYGPWGFLCGGYYPPTFFTSVIAWTTLSIVFWLGCWRVAAHSFRRRWSAWLWMMVFIGVTGLPTGQSVIIDVRQVAWALMLLSLHFFVDDKPLSVTKTLVVVSLGWLGLIKFTGMIVAAAVILIIAADEVLRQRRFPWVVLIFVASVLSFWLLAGQQLSLLLPYLSSSWQLSIGYTQAMMWGNHNEYLLAIPFLLVLGTVSLPFIYAGFAKHRFFGTPPLVALGVITLVVFKHGYVLFDPFHEVVAALSVTLIAMISLAVSWPFLRRHGPQAIVMDVLLMVVAVRCTTAYFKSCVRGKGMLVQFAESFRPPRDLSSKALLSGPEDLHAAYHRYLAQIRKKSPLPRLNGDVDVYPWQQDVVFAYGLHYHPRPVIQSYSAYTPKLAALNAAFLRSGQSAENILFSVKPFCGQYPSLDDGRSWPELLTRYNVNKVTPNFVLLKRSATPRKYRLVPLKNIPIHFGERVELPVANRAPIWVEIKIDKTILGTLACLFYKPPNLDLIVDLRRGDHLTYRLIPGMARGGFLLSPFINDNASFLSLFSPNREHQLAGCEVTSMTVVADTKSGLTPCYKSSVLLSLFRLDFSGQHPDEAGPEKELRRTPQVGQNSSSQ